jgi:hypothetical protein
MRIQYILPLVLFGSVAAAQTKVDKTVPVAPGQTIEMSFDYPKIVHVSTWDKNEISIQGTVSINNGENDGAFELEMSSVGNKVTIKNWIKNMKNLPRRITVARDGQKTIFKSKAEYEKYAQQNGRDFNMMNEGVDIEIFLEVKVPRNTGTRVESVYGMVEVVDFVGPLIVKSTYGGVDASVAEKATGELDAETNYGQIYSNLEVKFLNSGFEDRAFHTYVTAKPGAGPKYSFESKYGNVYLRKPALR